MTHAQLSRRTLLRGTAPLFISARLLGKYAPSNRITVGMIGTGRQGVTANLAQFLTMPEVQVAAVCDVDAWRAAETKRRIEDSYAKQAGQGGYRGCASYRDFRELLADKSIDAVMVSTPDHWHVPIATEAIKAGKDVSCEKPLTRTIADGRALSDLVRKHKRVFRNDSEFRSLKNFHRAVELVRNGRIGTVHTIRVGVPDTDRPCPPQPGMPVPPELDYERWQGPAPRAPYTEKRVHKPKSWGRPGWMCHLNYADGMISNWGAHLIDIAQWGNNTDRSGPIEIEGRGVYMPPESFWNTILTFELNYRYANGVRMVFKTERPYVRFEGADGWVEAEYQDKLVAEPASILDSKIAETAIHFPFKSDKQDFIDAVKTRGQTLEDAEVGHRTMSVCHLGHIAIQVGKKLEWDPAKEQFKNSGAANEMIRRGIREPRRG